MATATKRQRRRASTDPQPDHAVPDRPPYLLAREAEDEAAQAEWRGLTARWESLPEADRESIRAKVELANPLICRFKKLIDSLCFSQMSD